MQIDQIVNTETIRTELAETMFPWMVWAIFILLGIFAGTLGGGRGLARWVIRYGGIPVGGSTGGGITGTGSGGGGNGGNPIGDIGGGGDGGVGTGSPGSGGDGSSSGGPTNSGGGVGGGLKF